MTTTNEQILDSSIRHMVWLERYKTGTVNKIIALLNKSDKQLREQLEKRLSRIEARGYDLGKETTKRIEKMLAELAAIRLDMYNLIDAETRNSLSEFAVYEWKIR